MEIGFEESAAPGGGVFVCLKRDGAEGTEFREFVYYELAGDGSWRINSSPNEYPSFNRAMEAAIAKASTEAMRANMSERIVSQFLRDVESADLPSDSVAAHLDWVREREREGIERALKELGGDGMEYPYAESAVQEAVAE